MTSCDPKGSSCRALVGLSAISRWMRKTGPCLYLDYNPPAWQLGFGMTQEEIRFAESAAREKHCKRWAPYLSERAWGTVREDYSPYGNPWEYFPHDHARSRVYRWNEDGLAGICDRHQLICFALALWNGCD